MATKINRITAALGVTTALLVGVPLAVGTFSDTAQADVALNNFAVPDESVESEEVSTVSLFWSGGVSWADTPAPVETVEITVLAENPDGEMQELQSVTCSHEDPPDMCGFESATAENNYLELDVGLIRQGDWTSADFTPQPGGEVSHTIDVRIDTEVIWDGGSVTESASDTMTVTVTHPDDGQQSTPDGGDDNQQANPEVTVDFGTAAISVS